MANDDSISRQSRQDREYIAACKAAGIKPDPARYVGDGNDPADIDFYARREATTANIEPLKLLTPEAAGRLLDLIVPRHQDVEMFTRTAGRRCLALAWLLGRREEPLSEMARNLNITRASMSVYVRALEDKLGIHGRGLKASSTVEIYRANAQRSWKLRRLNKALADAVARKWRCKNFERGLVYSLASSTHFRTVFQAFPAELY